jgi:hypothetical protein
MREDGIMLMIKDDEVRCFMSFDEETIYDCIAFREYDKFHDDFIILTFKTDDKILRRYVTDRIVRKQDELTKEMIYETFDMNLTKGVKDYVMNYLLKNVR